MKLLDRILTIVVTATLTSAFWIVAGGSLIELASSRQARGGEDRSNPLGRPNAKEQSEADEGATTKPNSIMRDMAPDPPAPEQSAVEPNGIEPAPPALDVSPVMNENESAAPLMVPVLNVRPEDLVDSYLDGSDGRRVHQAIDIMAPEGTSVVAAAPGTIEKLHISRSGGKTIYIRSPDRRTLYYYAHLKEYAPGLREGQRVRRGQRLGAVGTSGDAREEAPHLHFAILRTSPGAEWWEPAQAVNPYPLLVGKPVRQKPRTAAPAR